MAFEEQLPQWENEGTQPPQSKRVEGWLPNEKPPASWFNWLFGRTYRVLKEFQEKAAEKVDVQQAQQTADNAATAAANAQSDIDAHLADGVHQKVEVTDDDDATSVIDAPLKSAGGLAVAKKAFLGGTLVSDAGVDGGFVYQTRTQSLFVLDPTQTLSSRTKVRCEFSIAGLSRVPLYLDITFLAGHVSSTDTAERNPLIKMGMLISLYDGQSFIFDPIKYPYALNGFGEDGIYAEALGSDGKFALYIVNSGPFSFSRWSLKIDMSYYSISTPPQYLGYSILPIEE